MPRPSDFWRRLFLEGHLEFDGPPAREPSIDGDTRLLFRRYFRDHALAVAGSALPFSEDIAIRAAWLVERSAWYLVGQVGTPDELERDLAFSPMPREPAEHLSADLFLQYLPVVYHRARFHDRNERLAAILATILRRWPLSGVLAALPEGPIVDLDLGGHAGLLLLYAERLAENFKEAWIPRGVGAPYLELVWRELGKDPALLTITSGNVEEREP